MKNLKDEIEGIVLALLNTYTLEDEQSEGVGKLALWEAVEALASLIEQEKERADIDSMKKIDGFMGFNVGGSGVWYALFDTESSFWKFLNRNSMSRSVEPPMTPVGRYSCRDTTEIRVLVNWLLEEYEQYLAERKDD